MARKSYSTARSNRHADPSSSLPCLTEHDLFALVDDCEEPFLLILDEVQDPRNLGACLRTADAVGAQAVIVPQKNTSAVTETVRRVACGGAERVPVIWVGNLARTMDLLKGAGVQIVGTSDRGRQSLYEVDLRGALAIALGAEERGLRRLTAQCCDTLARIPMKGKVDCLNLSVATGVCLFEAMRQRDALALGAK